MKKQTIQRTLQRINDTLNDLEQGREGELPISWITDRICWLWKFRYIDYEQMSALTDRVVEVLEGLSHGKYR